MFLTHIHTHMLQGLRHLFVIHYNMTGRLFEKFLQEILQYDTYQMECLRGIYWYHEWASVCTKWLIRVGSDLFLHDGIFEEIHYSLRR